MIKSIMPEPPRSCPPSQMYGSTSRASFLMQSRVCSRYFSFVRTQLARTMLPSGFVAIVLLGSCWSATVVNGQEPALHLVTNIVQLRQIAAEQTTGAYAFDLRGDVWWANSTQGQFVLEDDSGAEAVELQLQSDFPGPGQQVRLEGI